MERISVNASGKYDVVIGRGLIGDSAGLISPLLGSGRLAVITDDNVKNFCLGALKASLESAGIPYEVFVIPHGESSKNMTTLGTALEFLASHAFTRSDMIAALGGGVVGDLSGLCAAMYLRGIRYVQIPTTLLACVDSSVGGKCAVDLAAGKNLAGAFWQPSFVICDPSLLSTLPDAEFANGMAEVIKYGAGFDRKLFDMTLGNVRENPDPIIARCIKIKRDTVESDEFDRGERKKLNLGHTIGHAVEKCSGFSIPHGSAVSMGLYAIYKAYAAEEASVIKKALEANGLPVQIPYTADELCSAALSDKKRNGDTVSLVLPGPIGSCRIENVPVASLNGIIAEALS